MKTILNLKSKLIYFYIWGLVSLPFFAKADELITAAEDISGDPDSGSTVVNITNPLGSGMDTLPKFIAKVIEVVIDIATPLAVLAIIYSGFLFVKARGNPGELSKAKETLTWTLIGVAILLGAQVLANVISGTITSLTS